MTTDSGRNQLFETLSAKSSAVRMQSVSINILNIKYLPVMINALAMPIYIESARAFDKYYTSSMV
ncbi:MAG: hypothetical protein IK021_04175 [Methanobrevibacter sp.]|nr:hypothetical protein [Methanobrevibacter sp.]